MKNKMKNKMKNIVTLISLFTISCSSDFLEILPQSTVTISVLYKTDSDFKDAVTGCYTALRSAYDNMYIYGDVRSDDSWHALGNNVVMNSIDNFAERSGESVFASTWQNYYTLIFRANILLSKIESLDASVIPNKNRYIGEARFLRALAYFDLVRIYGDVPRVVSELNIEESYQSGRVSVSSIYNELIIPDLLVAENLLPSTYSGLDVGRATKGAAKALLGKVYLTRKDFVNAELKLGEVTQMGYALLPKYHDLFNYSNEHHSEYIFDIEYISGGLGIGSHFTNSFIPKSTGDHADNFFNIKGGLGELNTPTFDLFYAFEQFDPRRTITVDTGYYDNNNVWFKFFQIATFTKKYITPVSNGNDSRANWKVVRYADVLLMFAEALNENNKTIESLVYFNQVRARVGMPKFSGLSKDQTRERIYQERRFELGMEGHRWFDLIRTGRALNIMASMGMKPYNVVFPIPLREIQIINNPAILPQNPGYD
jgi:hypothetical protein